MNNEPMNLAPLLAKKESLEKQLIQINLSIDNLRQICDHQMEYHRNDGHYDYYRCRHCGLIQKE